MKQSFVNFLAMISFGLVMPYGVLAVEPPPIQWQVDHGGADGDQFVDVKQLSSGGYVMCGIFGSGPALNHDAWLVLADAGGNHVNSATYNGGDLKDWFSSVLPTADGGFMCAGSFQSAALAGQMWLVKVNSSLAVEWQEDYGGAGDEGCSAFIATQDGGYLLYGSTTSFGGDSDGYVLKVDANGVFDWQGLYGGAGEDAISSAIQLPDGSFRMYGLSNSFGAGEYQTWLIATSESGNMSDMDTYDGGGQYMSYHVCPAPDGGFYLAGSTELFGAGGRDMWLLHVDANGEFMWSRTWGAGNWEECREATVDHSGGCVMSGYSLDGAGGDSRAALLKYDVLGNLLWEKLISDPGLDDGYALCTTSDLGYVVAGLTATMGDPDGDGCLAKFGDDIPCVPSPSPITFVAEPHMPWINVSHCVHFCPDVVYELVVPVCPGSPPGLPMILIEPGCLDNYCDEDCRPTTGFVFGQWVYLANPPRMVQTVILSPEAEEGCACVSFEPGLAWSWREDCWWLPVELASFEAMQESDHVQIHFATASEREVDHYEILRGLSPDGEFVKIAELLSQGNSSSEQNYVYRDFDVIPGVTYYYYLASVDIDGARTEHRDFMASVTVAPPAIPLEYSLFQNFPNPFNSTTEIRYTLPVEGHVALDVYNISGQYIASLVNVYQNRGEYSVTFDANDLASGLYLCTMKTETYSSVMKMILIR
ncbi:T9SS type A sorting domain-containing protein [bacterium]|nr:T9SS type A sorting domain-containing protein [bacterium]